ncbi:MAG: hypothetical protein HY350_00235 [Candidatus Omnitrophica bacterium]|nr:hypothetical protein [Candidatus Omnitrophota bacterium]
MMFYMLENYQIGNKVKLKKGVRDIAGKGFDSILLQLRDTAFQLDDPEVIKSVEIITDEAHRLGLKLVLTFVTTNCRPWFYSFFKKYPKEGDIYVKKAEGRIKDGLLLAETNYHISGKPFASHAEEVAAGFYIAGNEFKKLPKLKYIYHFEQPTWTDDATDWHGSSNGTLKIKADAEGIRSGKVVLYVGFRMLEPDYGSKAVYEFLNILLDKYKNIRLDGIAWDEPGSHGATMNGGWGNYKLTDNFISRFKKEHGYDIADKLYLLDSGGRESYKARYDYFNSLRNVLFDAQKYFVDNGRKLFGKGIFSGIHHTWIGEAGVNDIYIGSIDYFHLSENLSGGFSDGAFSYEKSMCYTYRLSASIGKYHKKKKWYSNCWDYDPTFQKMAHFTRLMAILNLGWIAHSYGQAMMGGWGAYPHNDTWRYMKTCVKRIKDVSGFIGDAKERVKIAVYHSWESIAMLNNNFSQLQKTFQLNASLTFVNSNYPFDFLGESQVARADVKTNKLMLGENSYDILIVPWPAMLPDRVWGNIKEFIRRNGRVIFIGPPAMVTVEGEDISKDFFNIIRVEPFDINDYINEYLKHRPFPEVPVPMSAFTYPLKPLDCDVVFAGVDGCNGVKNRELPVYYLTGIDPGGKMLKVIRESGYKEIVETDVTNVIYTTYESNSGIILTATGRYDKPFHGRFKFDGNVVDVDSARLLCVKIANEALRAKSPEFLKRNPRVSLHPLLKSRGFEASWDNSVEVLGEEIEGLALNSKSISRKHIRNLI